MSNSRRLPHSRERPVARPPSILPLLPRLLLCSAILAGFAWTVAGQSCLGVCSGGNGVRVMAPRRARTRLPVFPAAFAVSTGVGRLAPSCDLRPVALSTSVFPPTALRRLSGFLCRDRLPFCAGRGKKRIIASNGVVDRRVLTGDRHCREPTTTPATLTKATTASIMYLTARRDRANGV
jgi:hypothetical protein